MSLTDGLYVARLKLHHLDRVYQVGESISGNAFRDEAQIKEYIKRDWVDVDSSASVVTQEQLDALSGTYATSGVRVPAESPRRIVTSRRERHTVVSDMSTGWTVDGEAGTTGNLTDSTVYALGSTSVSITTNGAGATARGSLYGLSLDMTAKKFRVWLRITDQSRVNALDFYVRSGGTWSNFSRIRLHEAADEIIPRRISQTGDWFVLDIPWSRIAQTQGTLNRAAVEGVRVGVSDNSTGPVTVHIGGLATIPKSTATFPNGVVSMTYDDGYVGQFTKARPHLDKFGFAGTAYVIQDQIGNGGYMTLEQLQQLNRLHGWEVGGHAKTAAAHANRLTSLTPAELETELSDHYKWLLENGLSGSSFAYPGGVWDLPTESAVSRRWAGARTTHSQTLEVAPPSQRLRMRAYTVADTTPTATITGLIDKVYTEGEWLMLTFHRIEDTVTSSISYSTANHLTVVNYLNTKGIPVRTVEEVLAVRGTA